MRDQSEALFLRPLPSFKLSDYLRDRSPLSNEALIGLDNLLALCVIFYVHTCGHVCWISVSVSVSKPHTAVLRLSAALQLSKLISETSRQCLESRCLLPYCFAVVNSSVTRWPAPGFLNDNEPGASPAAEQGSLVGK